MSYYSTAIGKVYKYVCVILLMLMVIIVFINTVLRYCFNSGIAANEELLRYMFIWITFLGIVSVYYDGKHISVTMLTDRMSASVRNIFECFMNILAIFAMFMLMYGSILYMGESVTSVGQITNIPFNWIIVSAVFAGIAGIIIILRDTLRLIRLIKRNEGA